MTSAPPTDASARRDGAGTTSAAEASDIHFISLTVNGETRRLAVEPREVLLDLLRERLGLTGTKRVCAMGNCGACTVHLDGRAIYSCLVLGVECEGREVRTVEGLADGDELHRVQRAFIEHDAFQCGYCTPGQIMSLAALVDGANDSIDEAAVLRATSGNLCRCGAYRNILAAGRHAAGIVGEDDGA